MRSASSSASSTVWPYRRTSAPYAPVASTLGSGALCGMTIVARVPSSEAASATLCAMRDLHPLAGTDVVVPAGDAYGLEAPLRMHVVEHGRRDRIGVLMLHGLPTTSYLWRDVARDLGQEHLCLMPDLIGLGSSEKPLQRRPYALDAQAR